ncbi:selenoneine synthase SenA [Rubrivivax sp. RP6-9]|uniref:selenoneine synthase SenA n=1 Tax=Rubrivivax sp. RP6-9 TaxID=3415750 RepID=UPI003CC600BB
MHDTGLQARHAGPGWLAEALCASRADTLATFAAYEHALAALAVPQRATLNPPLWELGHIGWFQEFWTTRNPLLLQGAAADPEVPRPQGVRPGADALYDSSRVPHGSRWSLPLPGAGATRDDLARQLDATLALLQRTDGSDAALYFFRLALFHEDMHHEAALYMAHDLGLPLDDRRLQPAALPAARRPLACPAAPFEAGLRRDAGGFAFDNELAAHVQDLPAGDIDSCVLRWSDVLPFVDDGGYRTPHWWSPPGAAWLAATQAVAPRFLRRDGADWQQWRQGRWQPLDPAQPACHLTAHEADAWCRWAGRRLPTEFEWERAAAGHPEDFLWGQVWEWTASAFAPYPGFVPHPYRDYSAPWFGSRRVLRGASCMTQPRLHHVRYRNFFAPERNDVPAGLRTCSLSPAAPGPCG